MITLKDIQQNEAVEALVEAANHHLSAMGYTDHGKRHVGYVSQTASHVLRQLGYPEREVELAAIAGWVHDVGNSINRFDHGANGAVLLFSLLREIGLSTQDVVKIIVAVGNHEEQNGFVSSPISAALAIADKTDAHKSRVRDADPTDPHDIVNSAIQENRVVVDAEQNVIRQEMRMDGTSNVLEYLSIYMTRVEMCEKAADFLGQRFELCINGQVINRQTK